jgi:hypothetical protein
VFEQNVGLESPVMWFRGYVDDGVLSSWSSQHPRAYFALIYECRILTVQHTHD